MSENNEIKPVHHVLIPKEEYDELMEMKKDLLTEYFDVNIIDVYGGEHSYYLGRLCCFEVSSNNIDKINSVKDLVDDINRQTNHDLDRLNKELKALIAKEKEIKKITSLRSLFNIWWNNRTKK